jgi:hypothetical protein
MIGRLEGLNDTSRIVPVARVDAVADVCLPWLVMSIHHDKARRQPSFRLALLLTSLLQSAFTVLTPTDRFDRPCFLTHIFFNTACRLYIV